MKDKITKAVKTWSEPKSVKDIQIFLDFVNFYRRFLKTLVELQYHSPQLTNQLATSFRILGSMIIKKIRIYQVVLVELMVMMFVEILKFVNYSMQNWLSPKIQL